MARQPTLRATAARWHRIAGLAAGLFWLIQIVTGTLIVFHWEIDDWRAPAAQRPFSPEGLEQRVASITGDGTGRSVASIWTTAGAPGRFSINVSSSDTANGETVDVAGDGSVLAVWPDGQPSVMDVLVDLHHNLLSGDTGAWIVGLSGALLASNLLMGLIAAWPRRGGWGRAVRPVNKGPAPVRVYSWHRALGLMVAVPALLTVTLGVTLVFVDSLVEMAGVPDRAVADKAPTGQAPIGLARATRTAMATVPGSQLVSAKLPGESNATYSFRLLEPGELRRAYGVSFVHIDAETGAVRASYPASQREWRSVLFDSFFALHTGEAGGLAGRLGIGLIGIMLLAMVLTGWLLFWLRRRRERKG